MLNMLRWLLLLPFVLIFVPIEFPKKSEKKAAQYRSVSMQEAISMMETEKDYIILDVRTYSEYEQAHISNAICIPNETITDQPIKELPDKNQLIMVYCRSGNRSCQAAGKLAKIGYTNIVEFGGIMDWTGETVNGK